MMWQLLDYFRMISYAIVFLTALNGITRHYDKELFYGDLVMAFMYFWGVILCKLIPVLPKLIFDIFLTCAAIFWALVHYINFIKK